MQRKIKEQAGGEKVTIAGVISDLKEKGYKIQDIVNDTSKIEGITLNKNSVAMNKNSNEEIYYTLTYAEEIPRYFVEIQEEYYEITVENEKFKVNREATDTEIINRKPKITVIVDKENIVTATLGEEDNIVLTSKEEFGKAIITIKEENSGVEKTCEVKVKIPIEQITLKQDTINIEREGKIELSQLVTISPNEATEDLIWTIDNSEIIEIKEGILLEGVKEGVTSLTVTNENGTNK